MVYYVWNCSWKKDFGMNYVLFEVVVVVVVVFFFECLICRKHTQPITVWKHPKHIPNPKYDVQNFLAP